MEITLYVICHSFGVSELQKHSGKYYNAGLHKFSANIQYFTL